ncbi:MAG: type II secretion system secretin GspD [Proteobacteria bacterium]|nr:type II secretion system secretin GspD [Pseudomonadota bacterium]HQR02570.1 type II secretion system secretin GspD [Rhodocyclaceae bacterium]
MQRTPALNRILAATVICLFCPWAAATKPVKADDVSLNFANADVETVVLAISKITHRNFIIDPRVKGTLNIVTSTPVSPETAYQILLSALRLQGYTLVEGRSVVKVVPEADAKFDAVPVTTEGSRQLPGDRLTTRVFTVRNQSATQLMQVIRPLVASNNAVSVSSGNTLVVTDYSENLQRISRIIDAIDIPAGDIQVIPVEHASAVDLATTIDRLLNANAGNDGGQRISIVADERINALLVHTDNPARIAGIRRLVANLDQAGPVSNVHVVYLKNADSTSLAQTLRSAISGDRLSAYTMAGNATIQTGAPGSFSSTGPVAPGPAAGTSNTAFGTMPGRNGGGTAGQSRDLISIQADAATNALVITAPESLYNDLRRVIDQLDRRRAQVYVEALIAEMTADRAAEFGIQWQSNGKTSIFGGTSFNTAGAGSNILNAAVNPLGVKSGLNLAVGTGTLTLPGVKDANGNPVTILNLAMLAHFLESQTHTNILSTPNLVMLDNEEAKIVVGQNLPFVTGQYITTGTATSNTVSNPFQTITRQDVGLTLKIRPQISENGIVRLQIYEENSSVVMGTTTNASGPITNKRSIETTALVDDGAIIALGGLVEDSYTAGADKVPLLGDIPVVGRLFRYDSRQRTKTNLVVFLRPKILRDAESYRRLTADRYDYVIGQQKTLDAPDQPLHHDEPAPRLPPLPASP